MSIIDNLPNDALGIIFGLKTNINCIYVCKRWNRVIKTQFPDWCTCFNYIDFLPNELFVLIFKLYGGSECGLVCKKWTNILGTEFTYCKNCKMYYKNIPIHNCIYIYAKTYNILRIMSGMAGLQYST